MEMIIDTEYMQGNKLRVTFRACPVCHEQHQLIVDYYAFESYMDGVKSLEEAFPELTPAEQELFLTAMDGKCYPKETEEY